jgi:hypothetical protein
MVDANGQSMNATIYYYLIDGYHHHHP